ncbi:TlpA family protein disulfide reductase [Parapedobacter tibetensis]|uniref:TlpA family protein disulfide reductase n=1 Tax=Parapedobacter tibetensis TaxID=2972951 RepID=UPI00214D8D59|nr:TlpA disulfide reductase family protein [Parapedobacter tibetensis]
MKRIILSVVAVYGYLFSYAQFDLKGHIKNLPIGETVTVNVPFVFGYFEDENKPLVASKDGSFDMMLPLDEEKIGYLRWGDYEAFLWMRPGAGLSVELDAANGSITFGGPMANANRLLHELELNASPDFYSEKKRVDVNEMQDSVIRPYTVQLAVKVEQIDASPLSAREKEFLKAELHDHFLAYLDLYVRTADWPTEVWSAFVLDMMKGETPQPRSYLRGPMYYAFIDTYLGFLETRAFANRDNPARFAELLDSVYGVSSFDSLDAVYERNGEAYIEWLAVKRAFDAQTAEEYLAKQIQENYEDGHLSEGECLLDELRTSFSNSVYLEALTSKRARLAEQLTKPNNQIVIPEDYRTFSSINTFVQQFHGKVVYLDIWGTWCGPCKMEMRHVPQLKERFEDNDVVFIYLDMDDDNKDTKWREYIQVNGITGIHLRKNKVDIQAIWSELLPNDKNLHGRYPSYFLFDKNGNLVDESAKRPSEKEMLYSQIKKYLRQ